MEMVNIRFPHVQYIQMIRGCNYDIDHVIDILFNIFLMIFIVWELESNIGVDIAVRTRVCTRVYISETTLFELPTQILRY